MDQGRRYTNAERIVGITARTAHLVAAGTYLGGLLLGVPEERLRLWRRLVAGTGAALLASEAAHSPNWPHQVRGIVALGHAALLPATQAPAPVAKAAAVVAVVTGSLGTHAPKAIRRWSVLERREVP